MMLTIQCGCHIGFVMVYSLIFRYCRIIFIDYLINKETAIKMLRYKYNLYLYNHFKILGVRPYFMNIHYFLAQLSRCVYTITFRKPYITILEIWMIGLWTVGPFDYNLIQMDDYQADSCAVSPSAFLLLYPLLFSTAVSCVITSHPSVHDCCCRHCCYCQHHGQKLTSKLIAWILRLSSD